MTKRDEGGRPRGDTGNDRCGADVVVRLDLRSSTVDEKKTDGTAGCLSSISWPMQHVDLFRPTLYLGPNPTNVAQ